MPSRHDLIGVPSMNLSWLEDFLALATHGGFSRGADARHMTQPAFSRRIRALEEWLGVVLVDRGKQPVVLTEAGAWYVGIARETLVRVARMPDEARAIADASAATVRFAATHALSLTFLPAWLRKFEGRVLASPVELISDVLQRCEDSMLDQRVQFLLCHTHPQIAGRLDGRCPSVVVGRDVLVPVSIRVPNRRDDQRARFSLVPDHPRPVPMLAYSAESGMGRIVSGLRAEAIEKAGAVNVFTAHLATVLKSMALDGRGVAWLPRSLIVDELRSRRLVAAAPPSWSIEIEIRIFRTDAPLAPAAEAFWSAVTAA
jgi:DNA-binding transcriptional LysR family regulator